MTSAGSEFRFIEPGPELRSVRLEQQLIGE